MQTKRKYHNKYLFLISSFSVMFSGDVTIDCSDDAQKYQNKIEETLQSKLGFKLKTGDSILTHFDSMSLHSAKKSRSRRKSKVFER